ncbi:hypothetical protein [Thermoflexus sp.]|uniref:hypothetical protein n=1 Tax=Thermoflexus sp. TaxID=1969742 RepID=UPI0035E422AD
MDQVRHAVGVKVHPGHRGGVLQGEREEGLEPPVPADDTDGVSLPPRPVPEQKAPVAGGDLQADGDPVLRPPPFAAGFEAGRGWNADIEPEGFARVVVNDLGAGVALLALQALRVRLAHGEEGVGAELPPPLGNGT